MISPEWISAIAESASTVVAAAVLYLAWKDRQAKLGAHARQIESIPPVTFKGTPHEIIREFVKTLRARNKAHDEILRLGPYRALAWIFGLLGATFLVLILVIFFSGQPLAAVIVWTPISFVTVIAGLYYVIQTTEQRRQDVIRQINAQFERFVRDDRFTPELAIELRNYLRPASKPATIAELDDYILSEFARRLNNKLTVVKSTW